MFVFEWVRSESLETHSALIFVVAELIPYSPSSFDFCLKVSQFSSPSNIPFFFFFCYVSVLWPLPLLSLPLMDVVSSSELHVWLLSPIQNMHAVLSVMGTKQRELLNSHSSTSFSIGSNLVCSAFLNVQVQECNTRGLYSFMINLIPEVSRRLRCL